MRKHIEDREGSTALIDPSFASTVSCKEQVYN